MRIAPVLSTLAALAALAARATPAAADDHMSLLATAGWMMPRHGIAESTGGGAEIRVVDDMLIVGVGASAMFGQTPSERRRDVMDVRVDGSLRLCEHCESVSPYLGLGLDVLHITTHEPGRSLRGSTLGLSGHAGLIGELDDGEWMWRAGVSYLGAIVPGTGEDLGGVTFSIGIGKQILD